MNIFKNLFGKNEDDESLSSTPAQQIKGIKPIVVYAVEILFSSADYRKEIFESLLKNGEKHNTRNNLVFIYQCTHPFEEQTGREQEIIALEQYLEKQEKNPTPEEVLTKKRSVTEEQAKNELLKFLSLDSTEVYYFVRDLADYPGASDMEWTIKKRQTKRASTASISRTRGFKLILLPNRVHARLLQLNNQQPAH